MVIFTAIGLLFTGMLTLVLLHAIYISATSNTTFIDYLKEIYMPDTHDCGDCPYGPNAPTDEELYHQAYKNMSDTHSTVDPLCDFE